MKEVDKRHFYIFTSNYKSNQMKCKNLFGILRVLLLFLAGSKVFTTLFRFLGTFICWLVKGASGSGSSGSSVIPWSYDQKLFHRILLEWMKRGHVVYFLASTGALYVMMHYYISSNPPFQIYASVYRF